MIASCPDDHELQLEDMSTTRSTARSGGVRSLKRLTTTPRSRQSWRRPGSRSTCGCSPFACCPIELIRILNVVRQDWFFATFACQQQGNRRANAHRSPKVDCPSLRTVRAVFRVQLSSQSSRQQHPRRAPASVPWINDTRPSSTRNLWLGACQGLSAIDASEGKMDVDHDHLG